MYSCLQKGLGRGALGIFYLTLLSFSNFCEPPRNFNPDNIAHIKLLLLSASNPGPLNNKALISTYCEAYVGYGNMGCQVVKGGIQNWKDFCLKVNIHIT